MLDQANAFALSGDELRQLDVDGFVVRERVFDDAECAAIASDCEELIALLERAGRRTKHVVGSYMFEIQREAATIVKWEPGAPEVVQGVEPFAHISPPLKAWGLEARLVDPCKAIVGQDELMLFTEKLNVKRARHGGPIVLHQDFPYWEPLTPVASRIATAMVFLDDATFANGCLEVAPGTHKSGKWPQRADADGFGSLEMDVSAFDLGRLRPLEVPAGTVALLRRLPGASLAAKPHRRRPPRPALLLPAGRRAQRPRAEHPAAAQTGGGRVMTLPDFGPPPPSVRRAVPEVMPWVDEHRAAAGVQPLVHFGDGKISVL